MTADDPLGVLPQIAALEDELRRLWRLRDANGRAARRNDDRLLAEMETVGAELNRLREARLTQAVADRAMNRAAKGRHAA